MNKQLSEVLAQMVIYVNREINIVYESRGANKVGRKKTSNQNFIKIFLILIISTAFIASIMYGTSFAVDRFLPSNNHFATDHKIASVEVQGLSREEARDILTDEITNWTISTPITFSFKENEADAENLFYFDIERSIDNALNTELTQTELIVVINETELNELINSLSVKDLVSEIDIDTLKQKLLNHASQLIKTPLHINLYEYLLPEYVEEEVTINSVTLTDFDKKADLIHLINQLNDYVIEPKMTFSVHEFINNVSVQNDYTASVLATAIYQVILPTNFEIVERNTSIELPSYSELGYEAAVDKQNDLKFHNPNMMTYTIKAQLNGDELEISLHGIPFENIYSIVKRNEKSYKPKTIVHYSERLSEFSRTVTESGKQGYSVEVVRKITDSFGRNIEEVVIFEDFYLPTHKVEVRGVPRATSNTGTGDGITNPNVNEGSNDENNSDPNDENGEGQNDGVKGPDVDPKEPDIVK